MDMNNRRLDKTLILNLDLSHSFIPFIGLYRLDFSVQQYASAFASATTLFADLVEAAKRLITDYSIQAASATTTTYLYESKLTPGYKRLITLDNANQLVPHIEKYEKKTVLSQVWSSFNTSTSFYLNDAAGNTVFEVFK